MSFIPTFGSSGTISSIGSRGSSPSLVGSGYLPHSSDPNKLSIYRRGTRYSIPLNPDGSLKIPQGKKNRKTRGSRFYDGKSYFVSPNSPRSSDRFVATHVATKDDYTGVHVEVRQPIRCAEHLIVSRGNPKVQGFYRSGGDFYCTKITQWGNPDIGEVIVHNSPKAGGGFLYKCFLTLVSTSFIKAYWSFPTPPTYSQARSALNSLATQYEATGRARTDPFRPQANNFQNIVETIRDAPKGVGYAFISWMNSGHSLSRLPKVSAKEFLNHQFGLAPTVEDLVKGVSLILKIDDLIEKLKRENAKPIRRKTTLKDETTVTVTVPGNYDYFGYWHGFAFGPGDGYTKGYTKSTVFVVNREKVWYVAKYKYFLPPQTPFQDLILRLKLSGLAPTIDNLWQITPWSWLVGWFSNIGDVLKNISSDMGNNVVREYSYIMKETESTTHCTFNNVLQWGTTQDHKRGTWIDKTTDWHVKTSTKMRIGGNNPYGLYIGIPQLSAWQLSILSALGLSRSKITNR